MYLGQRTKTSETFVFPALLGLACFRVSILVVTEFSNVTVDEGDDIALSCTEDDSSPDAIWTREDGGEVVTETRERTNRGSLRITNASVADTGSYTCKSGNKEHTIALWVRVTVKIEMVLTVLNYNFTPALENKSSEEYKETEADFVSAMDDLYKDDPSYDRTVVFGFEKGSVKVDFQIIMKVITTDPSNTTNDTAVETTKRVVQEVKTGIVSGKLEVSTSPDAITIKSVPPEPGQMEILEAQEDQITIKWSEPSDSDFYKIENYIVKYWEFTKEDQAVEKELPFTTDNYRVDQLEPDTAYSIQVATKNRYGSNFNTPIRHRTLAEGFSLEWWMILIIVLGVAIIIVMISVIIYKCRTRRMVREETPRQSTGLTAVEMQSIGTHKQHLEYKIGDPSVQPLSYIFTDTSNDDLTFGWEEIPRSSLKLMNELGSGAFGVVYKAELFADTGDVISCAVKTLKPHATREEIRDLKNELEIMVNVGYHPNLVNLIGACTQGELLVVLELAENGVLLELLQNTGKSAKVSESGGSRLTEELKWSIALDVAKGMAHLASHRCIHRDLAARNVLLGKHFIAKVSDYGMARDVYEELMYKKETKGKLPVKWMALESLETYIFTTESDVWSFGVLLWEMETLGMKPYAGLTTEEMIAKLKSGQRLERPPGCSDEMYDVMTRCWLRDPAARPTFQALVNQLGSLSIA